MTTLAPDAPTGSPLPWSDPASAPLADLATALRAATPSADDVNRVIDVTVRGVLNRVTAFAPPAVRAERGRLAAVARLDAQLDELDHAVDLLDAAYPGWRALVDPATLDLVNPQRCVLGQLFAVTAAFAASAPRRRCRCGCGELVVPSGYSIGLERLLGVDDPWHPAAAAFAATFPTELWVAELTANPDL